MGDKRASAKSRGSGLLMAGGLIAVLGAAVVYLVQRDDGHLDEVARAALSALSDRPVVQSALPDLATRGTGAGEPTPAPEDGNTTETAAENIEPPTEKPAATPTVEEVRVEEGGLMVVAGRAEPGARVEVIVDGKVVSEAQADTRGSFAALGTVPPSAAAQSLSLRAGEGDAAVPSDAEIILAPVVSTVPAPVVADAIAPAQPATTDTPPEAGPEAGVTAQTQQGPVSPAPQTPQIADPAPEVATGQIAVLRSDAAGVSLIETSPTRDVVLDTIGYSSDGVVQLGGRAGPDATAVRAYLNNVPVARLTVAADGTWRGDIPDVAAGIYTLRIDALSADGVVTSRVETPFQREAPEALAVAENSAGPLGAVTVQAGDTLWAIARERYGEGMLFVQVFEANRSAIRDPDLIYPGQVFDLPGD